MSVKGLGSAVKFTHLAKQKEVNKFYYLLIIIYYFYLNKDRNISAFDYRHIINPHENGPSAPRHHNVWDGPGLKYPCF